MTYFVVTYVPDGPVTKALKRRVKRSRPKPKLGNLGPLLDGNLVAARKRGQFRYHRDDLRLLKGVEQNPDIVDDGFTVLREILNDKGIAEPTDFTREAPYYPDIKSRAVFIVLLAALMTAGITAAVLLGQDDAVAFMVVAIVAISIGGTGVFAWILHRCVIRVGVPPPTP